MVGRLMLGLCAAALGLAAYNMVSVVSTTPAFAEAERIEGVSGTWRLRTSSAQYDRSEYLFQLGYGYLNGDLRDISRGVEITELGSADQAMERATRAIALFEDSIELSPGNAHAWAALAKAHMAAGDMNTALEATRTSWALAPHNGTLSVVRLGIIEGLLELNEEAEFFGLSEEVVQLSDEDKARANTDYKIAETFRSRQLELFMENAFYVKEIMTEETRPKDGELL